ncbi:MAG TPA: hypothetical protein VHA76_03375 [Solirubrobacterales bacterium]|nr:hypothetical protein [Solirubrobacterales bacterium]
MSLALYEESIALTDATAAAGIELSLLGGAAIFLHCPQSIAAGPYRELADLDAVTTRRSAGDLTAALEGRGYEPDARFNAMHGDRRMIFQGPRGKLDVFVDVFEMCHTIDLRDRVGVEARTLPVADLLATKLQIVELNEKDARDAAALLREHELGRGPGDHVDVDYLADLVGSDWGLWRTLTGTLASLARLEPDVADRAGELRDAFEAAPKSRGWKLRARVGERKRWYELPEEVG